MSHTPLIEIAFGVLALAGQLLNVYLNLRIRNAILEMKAEILKDVACEYRRSEVCDARMDALEARPRHA